LVLNRGEDRASFNFVQDKLLALNNLRKEICGEDRASFNFVQDKLLALNNLRKEICGEDRARTDDLLAASQAL
jgi:hypothetical protein